MLLFDHSGHWESQLSSDYQEIHNMHYIFMTTINKYMGIGFVFLLYERKRGEQENKGGGGRGRG